MYNVCMYKYIAIISIVFLGIFFFAYESNNKSSTCKNGHGILKIEDREFDVSISDTDLKREKGLSLLSGLKINEGMLFIFQKIETPSFWMKEMLFPLHIIWIDENMKIIGVENNILPESYPKTFSPTVPIKYVLEVPSSSYDNPSNLIGKSVDFKCISELQQ